MVRLLGLVSLFVLRMLMFVVSRRRSVLLVRLLMFLLSIRSCRV